MRSWLLVLFGAILSALVISAVIYSQKFSGRPESSPAVVSSPTPAQSPTGEGSPTPAASPAITSTSTAVDLNVDASGLSKTTVVLNTSQGIIKFKFYTNDAPKTVNRIVELIQKGFYNGLTFHRVVPGFVIQGGDPAGNGTGGSGQKLKAEFNNRRHVEGAVAMARAADPDSADSQFYISLGTHPHLDKNYTVFGQVIEGMDVAKKIQIGDKMVGFTFQ